MSDQGKAQKVEVVSKEEMAERLAHHLEQQPESVRASDTLMKRLEVTSLILPLAAVIAAIAVIAKSASLPEGAIPAALFAIPAALSLCMFFVGLHSVLIHAFPPVRYLMAAQTKAQGFFTGRGAVGMGVYVMVGALVGAALFGLGGYAFLNPDILEVLIPCIIVCSVGLGVWGTLGRKRMS